MLNESTLWDQVVVDCYIFERSMEDFKHCFLALFASEVTLNAFHQKLTGLALQLVVVSTDK